MQWETKKVSKLISNQIDFLSQDYNLYYLNLIKKTIQIFFNHKFSSQMICLYIVTRSKLTEFIMLSEKKYLPLCYSEKDVKVIVANQACNYIMCKYIESSLISKSYCKKSSHCSLGTEWNRRAVLCLIYSITYPRVHPLRTLASAGITVQSPSL